MALAFRSATSQTGFTAAGSGVSCAATTPTGVAAGDVLVAVCGSDGVTSTPAGWTKAGAITTPADLAVFWKIAGSSEPTSYTFTEVGSTSDSLGVHLLAFTGAGSVTPIAFGGSATATTAHVAPSVTPTAVGAMLVTAYTETGGSTTHTPPTGMTERGDNTDTWLSLSSNTLVLTSTAATGTKTSTASVSRAYSSVSFIVNAGAAAYDSGQFLPFF